MLADVHLQQLFPAAVAEHAHQGIIHFDKASLGGREKKAFVNVIEQLAVAALHLPPFADVFQHIDGLHTLFQGPVNARG